MVVNSLYKFVFIHVPKTAGTSVRRWLSALPGSNTEHIARGTKHETLRDFKLRLKRKHGCSTQHVPIVSEDYFCFAFVRNPWDRMASFSRYLHERHGNLIKIKDYSLKNLLRSALERESWAISLHSMRPQVDFITANNGAIIVNFVGHYEHLDDDCKTLGRLWHLQPLLPHLNHSSNRAQDFRSLYDDESIGLVYQLFRPDIDMFGYKFETHSPTKRGSVKPALPQQRQ